MSNLPDPAIVRGKLEELARVSKDLEANAKMQANAVNFVAAEQLRKRVRELTETQKNLMSDMVSLHPRKERQREYADKSSAVEGLEAGIKSCKEMPVLRQLEQELEKTVEEYVHCFQTIVAELMGAPPPESPILS